MVHGSRVLKTVVARPASHVRQSAHRSAFLRLHLGYSPAVRRPILISKQPVVLLKRLSHNVACQPASFGLNEARTQALTQRRDEPGLTAPPLAKLPELCSSALSSDNDNYN